jgi:hypothetical protein
MPDGSGQTIGDPQAHDFQVAQLALLQAQAKLEGRERLGRTLLDVQAPSLPAPPPEWYVWAVARLTAEKDQLQARVAEQNAEIADLRDRLARRSGVSLEDSTSPSPMVGDVEPYMRPLASYRVELEVREIRQGTPVIFPEDLDGDDE